MHPELRFRSRIVAGTSLFFLVVAVFFVQDAYFTHGVGATFWICVAGTVLFSFNLLLLRTGVSPFAASVAFCVELLALLMAAALGGSGLFLLTGPWNMCVVLLATYLLGARYGAIFGLAVALECIGFFIAHTRTALFAVRYAPNLTTVLVSGLAVIACVLFIAALYERAQARARRELIAQHAELDKAHQELKAAQQIALANEKLASIGLLAAGVAHEINNPMSFVSSNLAELIADLRDRADVPAWLAEYRDDILPATLDGAARVNAIVADLRRFARGEPEKPVAFDLADEVAAAVRISRAQLGPNQILDANLRATPKLVGMPRQISQVALNLIVNAVQAIGPKGRVSVTTGEESGEAVVTVSDDGYGMSSETVAKLFSPFFTTK
ncbi:MAG TPA: ATP-binding protein, partial [Myxococcaceae bacterium]|nr:ATP-binding protein [Myxococcaceae bacterium]